MGAAADLAAAGEIGLWFLPVASTVLQGSTTFAALLGLDPDRPLTEDSFYRAVHADDRESLRDALDECVRQKTELHLEFRSVSTGENVRWILLRGKIIDGTGGRPIGLGGSAQEVTEYKRIADEWRQLLEHEKHLREAAESANRVKDEFVALVSHELRSPLNAMLGWARILQTKQIDASTLKHAVETIERSARAQSKLIEDLIDSARISTGRLRLESHPVDLKKVVLAAVDIARPSAETKQLELKVAVDPAPLEVIGDADRLQQVVGNLLSNAVKFTPGGGRIAVELRAVEQYAEVVVSDSGTGINAELLPRIFNRFDQSGQASTRRHGGLGLGLALVHQLVQLHGGSVRAESAGEGKGAKFVVQLRLRAAPLIVGLSDAAGLDRTVGVNGGMAPTGSAPLSGLSILLVDDDPDARELTTMLLHQNGASVRSAASAAEAFSALTATADTLPDLLLSDIGMPGEDGYSLMARVRALSSAGGGRVPAIALTAFGSSDDRMRAFASGFDAHLTKPIEADRLVEEIARLAAQVRTASE